MNTRELVDALISGDSLAIENSFSGVMSDKVSTALDNYRVSIAQNMFNQAEDSETIADDETE
jgi:hypothetical protein